MISGALGNLFRNTTVKRKLLLIAIVATIPTAVLLTSVVRTQNSDASLAQSEKVGTQYMRPLGDLLNKVQEHRDLSTSVLGGEQSLAAQLAQSTSAVNATVATFVSTDKKLGGQLHTRDRAKAIQDDWNAIVQSSAGLTATQSFRLHTDLINQKIIPLMYDVGDASALLFDTTSSASHLAQAMVSTLPRASETLSQIRGYGTSLIASIVSSGGSGVVSKSDRDVLSLQIGAAQAADATNRRELQVAIDSDSGTKKTLNSVLASAEKGEQDFLAATPSLFAHTPSNASDGTGPGASFYNAANPALDGNARLAAAAFTSLQSDLQKRINAANTASITLIAISVIGIALAAGIIFALIINITSRVSRLASVADRISLGEIDAQVDVHGDDEIGELAGALERMQASLQSAITRLRTRRAS